MKTTTQYYSIIPAAGRSTRMGKNKLLLPWPQSGPEETNCADVEYSVLDSVLSAWQSSNTHETVVVLRKTSAADGVAHEITESLSRICSNYRVHVVLAENPPDMKASILRGLEYLDQQFSPGEYDRCFVSPADLPQMNKKVIHAMLDASGGENSVIVPVFNGKKGHPVLLPWNVLCQAKELAADQGLNDLISRTSVKELDLSGHDYFSDIDTKGDYEKQLAGILTKISSKKK